VAEIDGNTEGSIEHMVSTHTMINDTSLKIESFIHYTRIMKFQTLRLQSSAIAEILKP
jgi:hypothetical protein